MLQPESLPAKEDITACITLGSVASSGKELDWAMQRQHPWLPEVAARSFVLANLGSCVLPSCQEAHGYDKQSHKVSALMQAHLHPEAETLQQQPVKGGIHECPRVLQHSGGLCQQQGMEGWQLLEGLPRGACSCGQQQLQLGARWNVLRCCQGRPEEAQGLIRQSPAP